jgi:uracil-DNA glycosylase
VTEPWLRSAPGQSLRTHLDARVQVGATIYPREVLRALVLTPLPEVKVLILGQDPYHGPGQAHGLAFSVPRGVATPPSLRNILAELHRDMGIRRTDTDLSGWARQGVLLLNTALTVEDGQPGSHAKRGWEALTQALVAAVVARGAPCVYMLWGAHAQQSEAVLAQAPQGGVAPLVLKANHPSPLSARRPPVPFVGCGHFGAASRYLAQHGLPLDWAA